MTQPTPDKRRRMAITAALAAACVLGMTGMAFAAVPLYGLFCKVTGYGGTTQNATAAPSQVLDRAIEIRFDTNVAPGLPVEFKADQMSRQLNLGQTGVAFFTVTNTSDHPVQAVATYNVTPHKTGVYFQKLECFCFQSRELAAGETARLPVVFFVDPALASDPDANEVQTVTLSYTYFASTDEAAASLQ